MSERIYTEAELLQKSYRELQAIAKTRAIKANQKRDLLILQLVDTKQPVTTSPPSPSAEHGPQLTSLLSPQSPKPAVVVPSIASPVGSPSIQTVDIIAGSQQQAPSPPFIPPVSPKQSPSSLPLPSVSQEPAKEVTQDAYLDTPLPPSVAESGGNSDNSSGAALVPTGDTPAGDALSVDEDGPSESTEAIPFDTGIVNRRIYSLHVLNAQMSKQIKELKEVTKGITKETRRKRRHIAEQREQREKLEQWRKAGDLTAELSREQGLYLESLAKFGSSARVEDEMPDRHELPESPGVTLPTPNPTADENSGLSPEPTHSEKEVASASSTGILKRHRSDDESDGNEAPSKRRLKFTHGTIDPGPSKIKQIAKQERQLRPRRVRTNVPLVNRFRNAFHGGNVGYDLR